MGYVEKNIKVYKLYSLFSELLIVGPIITVYLLAKGLTFTQVTILQAIYSIGIVLFEVPTGAVADRVSRILSLNIGCIFGIVAIGLYIFGDSYILFICAEICFSLSRCFKSGADTALIYESLAFDGKEKSYQKIEGSAKQYMYYGQAIGSMVAGFLYGINIELPLVVSMINFFIALIISLFFKEVKRDSVKHREGYYSHIASSFKYILGHNKVKMVILYSMVVSLALRTGFWYYQPYMVALNIPLVFFGVIFFVFNLIAAQGSKHSEIFIRYTRNRTLISMVVVISISFLLLAVNKSWLGVLFILLQQVVRGVSIPIVRKYLNKHIEDGQRATVLSFSSLVTNLVVAIILPLAGLLLDYTNIFTSHLILGGLLLVAVIFLEKYAKHILNQKLTC